MNGTFPRYSQNIPKGREFVRQIIDGENDSYLALPGNPEENKNIDPKKPINRREAVEALGIAAATTLGVVAFGFFWRENAKDFSAREEELKNGNTWYRTVENDETVWEIIVSNYPDFNEETIRDITYNHTVIQRNGNPYDEDTDVDNVNEGDVLKITYPNPEGPMPEN